MVDTTRFRRFHRFFKRFYWIPLWIPMPSKWKAGELPNRFLIAGQNWIPFSNPQKASPLSTITY